MDVEEIRKRVENGEPLLLEDNNQEYFIYFDKFRVLIPVRQENDFREEYEDEEVFGSNIWLNGLLVYRSLIKEEYAKEIFSWLDQIIMTREWKIDSSLWVLNPRLSGYYILKPEHVYNGETKQIEKIGNRKTRILYAIYLQGKSIFNEKNKVSFSEIAKFGLKISGTILKYNKDGMDIGKNISGGKSKDINPEKGNKINMDIQLLLDCDKRRCGLPSYEREMLYDIKAGHWDVFEKDNEILQDDKLVGRDPKLDIKRNGVIGIDFGTKSTVVVKQEGSNEIRPVRIGSLSLKAEVSESDYENPTIISCINIKDFLENYSEKEGRPNTSCEDIFVSYNAYQDYKNCPTENFYAYYSQIKQWANSEKKDAVVQDIKNREKYFLREECSIEENCLNPIEIYAYYIGMYINNMRNGIYLKYVMSFPVKYSKDTKELIRKSFEKGIKKSLPKSIVEDKEIMSKYSVEYQISEPAAYAVTALEQVGFQPENENEKYLYGIFDFGGGTTDFDFGVWRGASNDEYERYNCDYVLECFGADSDVHLGGENILEMLAYQVFKNNKNMAAEKKISCALPVDQKPFIGGEHLVNNSQSANRNLTLLKEALRPLWEQHKNWQYNYCKDGNRSADSDLDRISNKDECIELQMYDFNGKAVPNCKFRIDSKQLIELIKERIQKGVDAFFKCIEKTILGNATAQSASEKVYIFLAGNSSKSIFVKEIFENKIKEYNQEYAKIAGKEQDRFTLIEPLKESESDEQYIPNAKTSVAYGLVKSRPGGRIFVEKNYETDSNEEARFKYYLGSERRGHFECKLSPVIYDEETKENVSYGVWCKFQGAGMGTARIYYTEDPRADSKVEKLEIRDIPFHEISFEAEADKYLFVKAIKPSTIEYTIAASIDDIPDTVNELDIDRV